MALDHPPLRLRSSEVLHQGYHPVKAQYDHLALVEPEAEGIEAEVHSQAQVDVSLRPYMVLGR